MRIIAFDLEIAVVPEIGVDISPNDHLGISVAAGVTQNGPIIWHGVDADGNPTPRMTIDEVRNMVADLETFDYIITWNGAAFDFHVLGVETERLDACRALARGPNHIDLMMLFGAIRRHRLSLKAAAEACGSHKGAGVIVSGKDAPSLWAEGKYLEATEYVVQDAKATWAVFKYLEVNGGFTWRSSKGIPTRFGLPPAFRAPVKWTVAHLLGEMWNVPEYWITRPVQKEDFTAW